MRLIKHVELSDDCRELKIRPNGDECIDLILASIQNFSAEVIAGKTLSTIRIMFPVPVFYMEFKIAPNQDGDMIHLFFGGADVTQLLFRHTSRAILDGLPKK